MHKKYTYICCMNKRFFVIVKKVMISFFVVLLFFVLPILPFWKNDIQSVFGNRNKFQGLIEIWNIDSFESGMVSKSSFLKSVATKFQERHKGLNFMIRNVSSQELVYLLEAGERPDLVSCSYGVACDVQNIIKPFSQKFDVEDVFLNAGKSGEKQFGVAWCFGMYYLISTEKHLFEAGVGDEDFDLISNAFLLGYEKVNKKNTKVVYSLGFGAGEFLLPQMALASYNNIEKPADKKYVFFDGEKEQSPYIAFTKFSLGESVVLLGGQRDFFRTVSKVKQGGFQGVIVEPLERFSDQVQFMFLCDGGGVEKEKLAEDFVFFLTSKNIQETVLETGMFSTSKSVKRVIKNGVICDITLDKLSDLTLNNVFVTKSQLAGFREKFEL